MPKLAWPVWKTPPPCTESPPELKFLRDPHPVDSMVTLLLIKPSIPMVGQGPSLAGFPPTKRTSLKLR